MVSWTGRDESNSELAVEHGSDKGYRSVARLRLASVLADAKSFEAALRTLDTGISEEFSGLASDRRGDIDILMGQKPQAKLEYQKAFRAFDEQSEYRRLVSVKLSALGVDPQSDIKVVKAAEIAK